MAGNFQRNRKKICFILVPETFLPSWWSSINRSALAAPSCSESRLHFDVNSMADENKAKGVDPNLRHAMPLEFSPKAFTLPVPTLKHDFRLACKLAERIPIGPTAAGGGHCNWIGLACGYYNATWGAGIIVPGGQDNQVVGPTSARMSTRTSCSGGMTALMSPFTRRVGGPSEPGNKRHWKSCSIQWRPTA